MSYAAIDPFLENWAAEKRLQLQTEYKDERCERFSLSAPAARHVRFGSTLLMSTEVLASMSGTMGKKAPISQQRGRDSSMRRWIKPTTRQGSTWEHDNPSQ